MKKNLTSCFKKENLGLFIIISVMILGLGCGKDDKNVSSVLAPSYYTFGTSDPKYLNAIPRNVSVSKSGANNAITWDAPAMTADMLAQLTGYHVYMNTVAPQGNAYYVNGPFDSSRSRSSDTATDGYTYTYTVTSVFYVWDTAYEFYTEIESLPSEAKVIAR
ncbi:MAG: hypothetical protein PHX78_12065 [bacterium]|nr:hypothetical protein [bacterium]